ncbi:MAG: glycosyltransferase family 2 protein [Planctomycetota bacterium]
MLLAIVIPVYNERETLREVVARIDAAPPPMDADVRPVERRLVLVDDRSTDGSRAIVTELGAQPHVTAVLQPHNQGKGAAVALGLQTALELHADAALIHDADFEYDPADHARALEPIVRGEADAVIGSRFAHPDRPHEQWPIERRFANQFLTTLSNLTTGLKLTDMECCTKVFTRPVLERIEIREQRFGLEPEIVARLAGMSIPSDNGQARPVRVAEVPVRYDPRGYEEGKKITWRDGLAAIRCILKYAPRN